MNTHNKNTHNKNTHNTKTRSALLLLTAGSAILLAGCGGGGGNGNTSTGTVGTTSGTNSGSNSGSNNGANSGTGASSTSQIIGKVTDTSGRGIPGVSIAIDTGGQVATTISTGGYRLANVSAAVHKITAAVTLSGQQYVGSTQVATTTGNLNSNVNILLSQVNQQATVQGYVRDTSGGPIAGASVYAAVPALASSSNSGNYSSLAAFTDSTGFYQIANIPSALPSGSLSVTASSPATANQNVSITQNSLTAGSVFTQNFALAPSANAAADTPAIVGINSFTQPTDGLVGAALQARLASGVGSVYEGLRRRLSPSYAALAARKHAVVSKRLASRAVGGAYAVEIDLGFNPPAATDINLLGYNVYRTTGAVTTNPPTETISGAQADFYDSLVDPLANYYTDLTTSSDALGSPYVGGTQYNFALSSLASSTTANTSIESAISNVYSITPFSPLTLTAPAASQTVLSPVTISWTPVTGATKYYVYIYSQYPTINTVPLTSAPTPFPAGTSSASVTLSGGSATYYAVVVAAADETETAPSAIGAAPTPTVNAAQSYSEITQFIVQ